MIARDKGLQAVIQWGPNDQKRREKVAQTLRDNFFDQIKFRHTEFYALTQQQLVEEDESFEKETGMNRFVCKYLIFNDVDVITKKYYNYFDNPCSF